MAGPKREDGSPAERLSGKVVMEVASEPES